MNLNKKTNVTEIQFQKAKNDRLLYVVDNNQNIITYDEENTDQF